MKGGDVAVKATSGDVTGIGGGAPGTKVKVSQSVQAVPGHPSVVQVEGSADSWAPEPPAGASLQKLAEEYAKSGRSVYWDALAVGVPPLIAAEMTRGFGVPVPAAGSRSPVREAREETARAPSASVPTAGPVIYNSQCATAFVFGKANWGSACLVQRYVQQIPGQVYVSNSIMTSGTAAGHGVDMDMLDGHYVWGDDARYMRVMWSPSGTEPAGAVKTTTFTVSVMGFGSSVTEVEGPGTVSPVFFDGPANAAFGSQWLWDVNGCTPWNSLTKSDFVVDAYCGHDTTEEADSVAFDQVKDGAPPYARVMVDLQVSTEGSTGSGSKTSGGKP
jgi:hypothetical protein